MYFNPRAPYGARLYELTRHFVSTKISIHAPHTGRDTSTPRPKWQPTPRFQSTRPIRGATIFSLLSVPDSTNFNPRAPYGARRLSWTSRSRSLTNFNPRAPYGARQHIWLRLERPGKYFNPRAPYGARQHHSKRARSPEYFNPRAPYGARLFANPCSAHGPWYFNPRAPYGARPPPPPGHACRACQFQSTRPIRGATL